MLIKCLWKSNPFSISKNSRQAPWSSESEPMTVSNIPVKKISLSNQNARRKISNIKDISALVRARNTSINIIIGVVLKNHEHCVCFEI
jgi:hypothetical protein